MAQGPSDTILVAIRITLRIRESKARNLDPLDRRRFVLSECFLFAIKFMVVCPVRGLCNRRSKEGYDVTKCGVVFTFPVG